MTDDEPCCRICFDTADSSANPLFRPCHCAGTSAWVHVECLDTWRRTSVNKRSFYECDACKFKYKFGARVGDQIFVARLLSTAGAIHALALCALASVIFVAGFVGKLFDSSLTWWDVLRCFNAHHLMSGAAATGTRSSATASLAPLSCRHPAGGGRRPRVADWVGLFGARADGDAPRALRRRRLVRPRHPSWRGPRQRLWPRGRSGRHRGWALHRLLLDLLERAGLSSLAATPHFAPASPLSPAATVRVSPGVGEADGAARAAHRARRARRPPAAARGASAFPAAAATRSAVGNAVPAS